MSSKDNPSVCSKGGIFTSLPDDATLVYVPYCSSDGWMGSRVYDGLYVNGVDIVLSVVDYVKGYIEDEYSHNGKGGKGGKYEHNVIFGGGSAGGRGAAILLDVVASRFEGFNVRGFLDSPYYVDSDPYDGAFYHDRFEGFAKQTQDVYDNFVVGGRHHGTVLNEECVAEYTDEPWKCLFGEYIMPFIKTQYLMTVDQYDGWQLSHDVHDYDGIESDPMFHDGDGEMEYVELFGADTHRLLDQLPSGANHNKSVVWGTACYSHHISESGLFYRVENERGLSQDDALKSIMEQGGGRDVKKGEWLDDVNGFECCCGQSK
jgi:hypothetical protein